MTRIAIIPARGGSKRIPRKNIRNFCGKPMIEYSIAAALESNLFDEVMVSTDSDEIAAIAMNCGAKVPFMRSLKSSDDVASTLDVIKEVLLLYSQNGKSFSSGCCIYATAPFITAEMLRDTEKKFVDGKFDSLFPVVRYSNPIQRALKLSNGMVTAREPENINSRSQDLEPAYFDAGMFYWFDVQKMLKSSRLWTENSGGVEIPQMNCQDIDNESDWQLAEMKYRMLHGS